MAIFFLLKICSSNFTNNFRWKESHTKISWSLCEIKNLKTKFKTCWFRRLQRNGFVELKPLRKKFQSLKKMQHFCCCVGKNLNFERQIKHLSGTKNRHRKKSVNVYIINFVFLKFPLPTSSFTNLGWPPNNKIFGFYWTIAEVLLYMSLVSKKVMGLYSWRTEIKNSRFYFILYRKQKEMFFCSQSQRSRKKKKKLQKVAPTI